jgi:hypothetical protein
MSSWIEWTEKKPNKTCDILCTTSSGNVVVAEYQKAEDMVYFRNQLDADTVIAWMPLPKKYEQVGLGDHVRVIRNHGSFPGVVVGIKKHDCGIKYCVLFLADSSPISMRPYELVYISRGELAKVKGSSAEFAMSFCEAVSALRYRENSQDDDR